MDLTLDMIALSVFSRPIGAITKLNAITKMHKYRGLHEDHHCILMAMEVHHALGMDCFIRECVRLFHDIQLGGHLSLSFCIQFFKQHVSIAFQCALTSGIERKIVLVGDACCRPPITIRSHNLRMLMTLERL
jgi:hypothetical protein